MMEAIDDYLNEHRKQKLASGKLSEEEVDKLLRQKPRMEKIAVKDAKLRTFITNDDDRMDLVSHVYDTTYGVIRSGQDNLVIIDDSIVRGTTLKKSIIRILDRLKPKKIVIVSSAPQIQYPDCYGIDMSKLKDFIAFRAAVELQKDRGNEDILREVYLKCKQSVNEADAPNYVKEIYAPFTQQEISAKIADMLRIDNMRADLEIIYQSVEGLHDACPNHRGDWYFTGNYPTRGGNRVVNRSYVNYYEGNDERAY
jgi:amidophosphoribosyltransferase